MDLQANHLKDSFGRVHDYLRVSLTDTCNLRCTYCMPEDPDFLPQDRHMTADEILQIASICVQNFGIKKIRLTGGEPLARKDFDEILSRLSKLKINLGITTNGVLLDRYLKVITESGIRSLNISLDTLRADRFLSITKRDYFHKVLANIELAKSEGFLIKLNVVVMRGVNDDEISSFINLTKHIQFHIRFIEFMPFSGNQWKGEMVVPYKEMLDKISEEFEIEKLRDGPNDTAKAHRVVGWPGTFSVISTVSQNFCSSCNRIRLTADGKLRNCLFAKGETDLLSILRKGEDISEAIRSNVFAKQKELGGLPSFDDKENLLKEISSRSMLKIGG